MDTRFDLNRFVKAQNPIYETALAELRAGRKETHWMWYIFPQIEGLGQSPFSTFYGMSGRDEAKAYMAHPVLGPRLIECTKAALAHASGGALALFGHPDDLKFQSSMSLFSRAKPCDPIFEDALNAFYGGVACQPTLEIFRIAFHQNLRE